MSEEEQQEMPPPPPLPLPSYPGIVGAPNVTFAEGKLLLKQAKSELKVSMKNANPTTKWWRPAHSARYCQYCSVGVETPLTINPSTGLFFEACDQHQFLIDAITIARGRVLKFETMVKRIKDQELVPRAELAQQYDTEFTPEERAHLRQAGWIHQGEVIGGLQRLIKDLQLEGK